jgi:hypothetical protein
MPIQLNTPLMPIGKMIDIYDPMDRAFNDRCFSFIDNLTKFDTTINYRREFYFQNKTVQCSDNCTYEGFDFYNFLTCKCIGLSPNVAIQITFIGYQFTDEVTNVNLGVIACYKDVFKLSVFQNIGMYTTIFFLAIGAGIVFLIHHIHKLSKRINMHKILYNDCYFFERNKDRLDEYFTRKKRIILKKKNAGEDIFVFKVKKAETNPFDEEEKLEKGNETFDSNEAAGTRKSSLFKKEAAFFHNQKKVRCYTIISKEDSFHAASFETKQKKINFVKERVAEKLKERVSNNKLTKYEFKKYLKAHLRQCLQEYTKKLIRKFITEHITSVNNNLNKLDHLRERIFNKLQRQNNMAASHASGDEIRFKKDTDVDMIKKTLKTNLNGYIKDYFKKVIRKKIEIYINKNYTEEDRKVNKTVYKVNFFKKNLVKMLKQELAKGNENKKEGRNESVLRNMKETISTNYRQVMIGFIRLRTKAFMQRFIRIYYDNDGVMLSDKVRFFKENAKVAITKRMKASGKEDVKYIRNFIKQILKENAQSLIRDYCKKVTLQFLTQNLNKIQLYLIDKEEARTFQEKVIKHVKFNIINDNVDNDNTDTNKPKKIVTVGSQIKEAFKLNSKYYLKEIFRAKITDFLKKYIEEEEKRNEEANLCKAEQDDFNTSRHLQTELAGEAREFSNTKTDRNKIEPSETNFESDKRLKYVQSRPRTTDAPKKQFSEKLQIIQSNKNGENVTPYNRLSIINIGDKQFYQGVEKPLEPVNDNDRQVNNFIIKQSAELMNPQETERTYEDYIDTIHDHDNNKYKYIITQRDYDLLTSKEKIQYDNRHFLIYLKDELIKRHWFFNIFYRYSFKEPTFIRGFKFFLSLCLEFAFHAILFTDTYIYRRAISDEKVIFSLT